jgi:hypothetical protein
MPGPVARSLICHSQLLFTHGLRPASVRASVALSLGTVTRASRLRRAHREQRPLSWSIANRSFRTEFDDFFKRSPRPSKHLAGGRFRPRAGVRACQRSAIHFRLALYRGGWDLRSNLSEAEHTRTCESFTDKPRLVVVRSGRSSVMAGGPGGRNHEN